jgi:hypothetical protein
MDTNETSATEGGASAPSATPAPAAARDLLTVKSELLDVTNQLVDNPDWTLREGLRERRGKLFGELEALERKAKPLYDEKRLAQANGEPKEGEKQDDGLTEPSLADFGGRVEIQVPADLTASQKEIAGGYAQDIGAIASEAGIPGEQANDLFAHILDLDLTMTPGIDGSNRAESMSVLNHHYGEAEAKRLVQDANRAVRRLPASVKAWLEQRDAVGRALGDVPSVVAGLAAWERGDLRLSPADARKELARVRASKEYGEGKASAVDRVRLLSRVAARGADQQPPSGKAHRPVAPSRKGKLEAELSRLRMDEGYTDKGRANHKQILARVQEIYRELHPDSK